MRLGSFRFFCRLAVLFSLALSSNVAAEKQVFGGHPDRFKGGGDKVPPECAIDLPRAAGAPFYVKWYCEDNFQDTDPEGPDYIRTELWIYRKGEGRGRLVDSFLGFPASVYVDEGLLQVQNFSEGLPVSFRLYSRDRSGTGSVSPKYTVHLRDSALERCRLKVKTEKTASTETTTGKPSMLVDTGSVEVSVTRSTEAGKTEIGISSPLEIELDEANCQIFQFCQEDSTLRFNSALSLDENNKVSGGVRLHPGDLSVTVSGQANYSGAIVESLSAAGKTEIDGAKADLSLSCY